jgi:hypothetical protein
MAALVTAGFVDGADSRRRRGGRTDGRLRKSLTPLIHDRCDASEPCSLLARRHALDMLSTVARLPICWV